MKRFLIALLALSIASPAGAQLAGTRRIPENIWIKGDRKISFGPGPNATIQYLDGNLVIDVVGGGKASFPDGIDAGAGAGSFGASLVFEGATANAFETTFAITDPTADRTVTFADASGNVAVFANANTTDVNIIFEGTTADAFETTFSVTDPTADRSIVAPDGGGTIVLSSLATNAIDAANAVTGASNALVFEGATANGFETSLTVTDPTADRSVAIPNVDGTLLVSLAGPDESTGMFVSGQDFKYEGTTADGFESMIRFIGDPGADVIISIPATAGFMVTSPTDADGAHGFWGGNSSLVFEGATADAFEITVSAADAGADATVTIPANTGTMCVGGALVATAGANTACNTTCGAGKCCGAQNTDAAGALVGCADAAADICSCMP